MSGVIMEDGTQYEHCQGCRGRHEDGSYSERGAWVAFHDLAYQERNELWKCGRDLCAECVQTAHECELKSCHERATVLADGTDWIYQFCDRHFDELGLEQYHFPF